MPEYLAPGVYVEEVPAGPVPIEGVGTSTSGFVGQTRRGPIRPRLVTSWLDFQRWFGGLTEPATSFLPHAIRGFFDNGGQRAYVARVTPPNAVSASLDFATAVGAQNLHVEAVGPGSWGNRVFVRIMPGTQRGFRITLLYYGETPPPPLVDPTIPANVREVNRREPASVEDYDNLGTDARGPRYALTVVSPVSRLVRLSWTAANQPGAQPNPTPGAPPPPGNARPGFLPLQNGGEGANPITPAEYQGAPAPNDPTLVTGLAGIEQIDEVALLCVPDEVNAQAFPNAADRDSIRSTAINQCERLKDRFAVLSIQQGQDDPSAINVPADTSYAAVYYPWITIVDPATSELVPVPPAGHMVGIYARTDGERGVHKAPANETVRGILTSDVNGQGPLEFKVPKGVQDVLNPKGVNVIRDFRTDGRGIRVWGARTCSSDPQWKYVNVRRLFIFVEESIDEGTQWVVFEPNDEFTWARVTRSITNFLTTVWRSGALMGTIPEEAFFVRCDRTTMTQDDFDNGRLICLVGIAPVKPAEFVIIRISQKTADPAV